MAYYQQNVPTGVPLYQKYEFTDGGSLSQTYTVPTGKTAVISSIRLKFTGYPFKQIVDEHHVVSSGKVTLTGDAVKPHKNIVQVDSAYDAADGVYKSYNGPWEATPHHQWYYHGQHSNNYGHNTMGYGTNNPRTGEVWVMDSSSVVPPDLTDVYVDYMVHDWSLTVAASSLGWSYVLSDMFDYIQHSMHDSASPETLIMLLAAAMWRDMLVEGGLVGPLSLKMFVPLASNLLIEEGDTLTFTFDMINDWGINASISIEIFGWLTDNP